MTFAIINPSETVAAEDAYSGSCGEEATYLFDPQSGIMTISGSGEMAGYFRASDQPWAGYQSQILKVIIESGITKVGNYTFCLCENLSSAVFNEGLIQIGYAAFQDCSSLEDFVLPNGLETISAHAFENCTSLYSLTLPENVRLWEYTFSGCSNLILTIPTSTAMHPTSLNGIPLVRIFCDNTKVSNYNLYGAKQYERIHYYVYGPRIEPTCEEDGQQTLSCEKCSWTRTEIIPGGHVYGQPNYEWSSDSLSVCATAVCQRDASHVLSETVQCSVSSTATCTQAGEIIYRAEFADEHFETQIRTVHQDALGHDYGEWIVDLEPTCTTDGHRYRVCSRDANHIEEEVLAANGHDYQFSSFEWTGYTAEAIYVCANDEEHVERYPATVTSEVTTQPTCESTGIRTYTASYDGHKDTKEETISALGHDYQFSKFEWNGYTAEAVYVCANDEEHVERYPAAVTSEVTTQPTCETTGIRTYTASYDGHTDTKEETIEATGHNWGEPEFFWAETGPDELYPSSAQAVRTCQNDDRHQETVDCQIATIESGSGYVLLRATAVFEDETVYEDQRFEFIEFILQVELMDTDGIHLIWPDVEAYDYEIYRDNVLIATVIGNNYLDKVGRTMGYEYKYAVRAFYSSTQNPKNYYDELTVIYNPFSDVVEGTTSFTHVAWAYNNEIVSGLTNDKTRFGLTGRCTRTQFCIMLWRMDGKPSTTGLKCPFTDIDDVTPNNRKGIIWCYNEGIVNGTSPTTFAPSGDVTRAQLAIMMWKMAGQPSTVGMSCPFTDLDTLTANNKKAVIWCYNMGMISSITGTRFKPKTKGTRALLTEMMYGYEQWYHIVDPNAADVRAPRITVLHESEQILKGETLGILPYAIVEDDMDDHVVLKLEGNYDCNRAGTYDLKFVAEDESGNRSEADFTLEVCAKASDLGLPYPHNPDGFDYKLVVNIHNQTVRVYRWDGKNYNDLLKIFTCSTGTSTPQRIGTWETPVNYRWKWLFGDVYGQYATRIVDTCLFHSVPYFTKSPDDLEYLEYNKLGTPASMGCVRLRVIDAKWIYDNCPVGTTVVIKDDETDTIPVQWLEKIDISSPNRGWDPTDPDPNNPWNK
ncbi:MAG: leucine-rich repeat protein [Erysipelotrichaceae bacterium]|nr:leucine-rich repeat protein [Erysipelotrichaceae bacterium]